MVGLSIVVFFFIVVVVFILLGLCYVEFGVCVFKVGFVYIYSYVMVGEFCVFVIGWNLFFEYVIGVFFVVRVWSDYFDFVFDGRICNYILIYIGEIYIFGFLRYLDFFVFVFLLLVIFVFVIGVKNFLRFNNIFIGINFLVILFIICVGIYFVRDENWINDFILFGIFGVFMGVVICFYVFVGFDVIVMIGEEVRNLSRVIFIFIVLFLGKVIIWLILFME